MSFNEGGVDRIIRILAAFVLAGIGWMIAPGIVGGLFFVVAIIAFVTGVMGWCPAYALFHISTSRGARA
jgi:hypothetical protein